MNANHINTLELPPLPEYPKSSRRPSPLEPITNFHHSTQHSHQHLHIHPYDIEIAPILSLPSPPEETSSTPPKNSERALGSSSPQSLRKILDNSDEYHFSHNTYSFQSSSKRRRDENNKDDFVQLPQPPRQLKALKQPKQAVPPIIIGLHDLPPQSTLFPPIASSSFHDSHGRNTLNVVEHSPNTNHYSHTSSQLSEPANITRPDEQQQFNPTQRQPRSSSSPTIQSSKPLQKEKAVRHKFTEDESIQLLLAVKKYGVGKWSVIIKDDQFTFDNRTAVDLKDRFRVLCPQEMGGKAKTRKSTDKSCSTASLISFASTDQVESDLAASVINKPRSSIFLKKPRKVRSDKQRKARQELLSLGIPSLTPSTRRKVKPFTPEEDKGLLLGFECHGHSWSSIQKDDRFGLRDRSRCDLRDRMRSKWPDKWASAAKCDKKKGLLDANHATEIYQKTACTEMKDQGSSTSQVSIDEVLPRSSHDINTTVNIPSFTYPSFEKTLTSSSSSFTSVIPSISTLQASNHPSQPLFSEGRAPKTSYTQPPLSFSQLLSEDEDLTRAAWGSMGMADNMHIGMGLGMNMNIANLLNGDGFGL